MADGFSAEHFANLMDVESTHFWFAARNALITWALAHYFPDARTFLEVGSGTGQVVAALRRAFPSLGLTACEGSLDGLVVTAGRLSDVELVHADARKLPYDAEFDAAGAFDVLEHVSNEIDVVRQLTRAVKPGGGVLVTVPQHPRLWGPLDEYSGHQRRYTRRQLVQLLRDGGLHVERVTSFVALLLPALLLSRSTRREAAVDPLREFRIPAAVNQAGRIIMGIEGLLIKAGFSFPGGGSLLAVARRPVGQS